MWPNPQFPADLVTFTEEILYGKLSFLCSVKKSKNYFPHKSFIDKVVQFNIDSSCCDEYH